MPLLSRLFLPEKTIKVTIRPTMLHLVNPRCALTLVAAYCCPHCALSSETGQSAVRHVSDPSDPQHASSRGVLKRDKG